MPQNANSEDSKDFDKKAELWYNNNKDEKGVVRINTKGLKPIHDTKCVHDPYYDQTDPDNSWARVIKCRNCPFGWLLPK